MHNVNVKRALPQLDWNKYFPFAILLVAFLMAGLYAFNAYTLAQSTPVQPTITSITHAALEQEYGLRVNMVAVTAATGLIDIRLKIVDGVKAQQLLGDKLNFLALRTADGTMIYASEDIASQEINFDNGSLLFVLFPNAGSKIQTGTPVTIQFGNLILDPVIAK